MPHHTLLAVPITSADPPLAEQVRAAAGVGADLVELRVDCIGAVDAVADLLARPAPVPFILTIRTRAEGGAWDSSADERIALFERLGRLQPGYIDVEYAAWSASAELRAVLGPLCGLTEREPPRATNRLILSQHDLRGTPVDLEAATRPLRASPAAVIKAVFTARDAADAWRVLGLLRRCAADRPAIVLAMGPAGLLTRVLAAKFGGFLTFAALEPEAASAPAQPTVRELLQTYRWGSLGADTRVFGVVGWPVGHSRGPAVHNAALAAEGIDAVYLPMPVAAGYADFSGFMDLLTSEPELDVAGLSITIPHKTHAVRWLDTHGQAISPLARRVGAVNTVTRTGPAGWLGDNTDATGLVGALQVAGALRGSAAAIRAAVLGAGGVARAAVVGLQEQGCRVTVYNRTSERAVELAEEFGCAWRPWEDRGNAEVDVLINCTSVGMSPHADASPFPAEGLRPGLVVLDAVYTPPETALLRAARGRGCRVVSGVEMFLRQAADQFAGWQQRMAPLEVMRRALGAAV